MSAMCCNCLVAASVAASGCFGPNRITRRAPPKFGESFRGYCAWQAERRASPFS